jgi:Flp pilus assembly protein TadB
MTTLVALVAAACSAALWTRPGAALPAPRAPVVASARRLPPTPVLAGMSAALAVFLLLPSPLGLPASVVAGLVATRVVRRLEPASVRRRRARLEAALPHVVDLMSTCLAAGGSAVGALGQIARVVDPPMRDELASYVGRLALGADPVSVWRAMAGHPQLGALGRTLKRSSETGASIADALTRLGTELRAERRTALEAQARTIEVKASLPLGLCLLPAFVLIGVVPMIAGSFSLTFFGS